METQVARGEVELLIIGRVIRNVHLAVFACYAAILLQNDCGVVVQTGSTTLEQRGNDDYAQLFRQVAKEIGGRAWDGLCQVEVIDTLVRICPDDTLLYTGGDEDHPDLYEMDKELQSLRTLEGQPYRLLKLPLPRPIYDEGDRLPATYANYLVVNGAVLVPTYNQPDLDQEAMQVIQQAFPDREIVGIDCCAVIKQHGSLHCCTMQYYEALR